MAKAANIMVFFTVAPNVAKDIYSATVKNFR
jgi:hypothetical protein